ncbi:MAG: BrnT family toxin [Thermomicrobiales bacterium]|nr:BrnT family toxin [Thermomicrobiales bacterium]
MDVEWDAPHMRIEWDEAKRLRNIEKHDIDFVYAQRAFDGRPVLTMRSAYVEETRWITTTVIDDLFITVIWTQREDAIRIISARRGRNAEKRAYRQLHPG